MLTVHLSNLLFFAKHGYYAQEQLTGNIFEVSLSVTYKPAVAKGSELHKMVNYETLFFIVKNIMHQPHPLLEEIGEKVIAEVITVYPFVTEINFTIYKQNPPIPQLDGKVGITLNRKFEN